jgi:hypothetical protein
MMGIFSPDTSFWSSSMRPRSFTRRSRVEIGGPGGDLAGQREEPANGRAATAITARLADPPVEGAPLCGRATGNSGRRRAGLRVGGQRGLRKNVAV